jgi:hypothetical protein
MDVYRKDKTACYWHITSDGEAYTSDSKFNITVSDLYGFDLYAISGDSKETAEDQLQIYEDNSQFFKASEELFLVAVPHEDALNNRIEFFYTLEGQAALDDDKM